MNVNTYASDRVCLVSSFKFPWKQTHRTEQQRDPEKSTAEEKYLRIEISREQYGREK